MKGVTQVWAAAGLEPRPAQPQYAIGAGETWQGRTDSAVWRSARRGGGESCATVLWAGRQLAEQQSVGLEGGKGRDAWDLVGL